MCGMAVVHSRFGKLVFGRRMRGTGGVCAEGDGVGAGLWWRRELNWCLFGWRWEEGDGDGGGGEGEGEGIGGEVDVDEWLNA